MCGRESGIVLADCVSSPRSSHRTSFAQEVQEGRKEGRRKEMLLLTQQRQLFEVKRPSSEQRSSFFRRHFLLFQVAFALFHCRLFAGTEISLRNHFAL